MEYRTAEQGISKLEGKNFVIRHSLFDIRYFPTSFIPHPRIQEGIKQVDHEIDPNHCGAEKQVDSGDYRVVSVIEGIQQETTESRQVEDVLNNHGAPDQDRHLEANGGHDRDEGILDGVSHDNHPLLETLGPGSADIVLPEHLQHHRARHPHGGGGKVGPQNQAGDEEHPQIPQRVFAERNQPHRRGPAPPDRRVDYHHEGEPEVGRCQAQDGDGAAGVVDGSILANRRVDADGERDHQPDDDGHDTQLKGDWQSPQYLLLYRPRAHQGVAQGAVPENISHPASILHVDRHVQSQHTLKSFTVNGATPIHLSHHDVYDIARDEADREKDQDAQDEQGGDDQQQPPDDIGSHQP